jgi:hypothetical protein
MMIDLSTKTKAQLENLIENRARSGDLAGARDAALERIRRGHPKPAHWAHVLWRPDRVEQLLEEAVAISRSVAGNKRKAYVEAGGLKRKNNRHPDHMFIDSYSGIKTKVMNARFCCQTREVGNEPDIFIEQDNETRRSYSVLEFDAAIRDWERIALAANSATH